MRQIDFSTATIVKQVDSPHQPVETDNQLKDLGLSHTCRYGGYSPEGDKSWNHPHFVWHITLCLNGKSIHSFEYRVGTGHCHYTERRDINYRKKVDILSVHKPTLSDIVHCMVMDWCDSSFLDWCDEFGFNSDSIKDAGFYQTVCETTRTLRQGRFPIDKCREILENY